MSMDFTTNFSGPPRSLAELLCLAEQRLGEVGLRRSSAFVRAFYDENRGVFDEVEDGDEVLDYTSLDSLNKRLAAWQGASATYQGEGFNIYLLTGISDGSASHCWVDISDRKLRQLGTDGKEASFYAALGAVAISCAAIGAFGGLERPFVPVMPNRIVAAVFGDIEESSDPADLGLIAREVIDRKALGATAGPHYRIREWSIGYWLLEEREWYLAKYLGKTEF